MNWKPAAGLHAIERVRIILTFSQPFSSKMVKSTGSEFDEIRSGLGFEAKAIIQAQTFVIQQGAPGLSPEPSIASGQISGWRFQRLDVNGRVLEFFELNGPHLVYESIEYGRWPNFHKRFSDVTNAVFGQLIRAGDLVGLALEYFDRFVFDVPDGIAKPSEIMPALSSILPKVAMEQGELWHLHRGWFEPGDFGKLLINQNFDAQDVEGPEGQRPSIQIYTKAEGRQPFWRLDDTGLDHHLQLMHDRTKSVFGDKLTHEMLTAVGMGT